MDLGETGKYFDAMPIAFAVVEVLLDGEGRPEDFVCRYANRALAKLERVELDELIGRRFYGDLREERRERKWMPYCYASAFLGETHELRTYIPRGGKYLRIISYPWMEKGCCACVLFDETELVTAEKRLEHLARFDGTTQFHNRNAYLEYLDQFRRGGPVGVVFVDVNGLKETNDRYGHDFGDVLFRLVRDGINSVFGKVTGCRIFRIGGDEFIIVLPGVDRDGCRERAEALRACLTNRKVPHMPPVLASVGWSWAGQAEDLEQLATEADRAMYLEKRAYYRGRHETT